MLHGLSALWAFLSPRQRLGFVAIVALMSLGAMLEMIGIGALLPVIGVMQSPSLIHDNRALSMVSRWFGDPGDQAFFIGMLLALAAFFVLKNCYLVLLDIVQYRFLANLQGRLSSSLIAGYLARPWAFHIQVNTAQLIRNVTTEVSTVYYYVLVPVVQLIAESMVLLALFVLMMLVDPAVAALLCAFGGVLVYASYRGFHGRMAAIGQLLQDSSGRMVQYAQEGLGALKEIKVMGREDFFRKAFSTPVEAYARAVRRAQVIHNFPLRVLETIFVAAFVGILVLLALRGRSSSALMLLGVYAAAAFRLIPSLSRIMTAINRLKQGKVSLTLVMEGLEGAPVPNEPALPPSPEPPLPFERELIISALRYRYPEADRDALGGVSLSIRRGEMVAFVGRSGSGKTTLVDCILGLLEPDSGDVLVDGVPIRQHMRGWRSQIGYIPQDIYLTDDSLRRNIALGLDDAEIDLERVWAALEAAQMADFVRGLPAGLETAIGERGVRLSGGQRQRIGIARAMYGDPAVLVLDEATSALDHQTEKAIVRTISGLKGSKTIIVIAHRLSTIEDCEPVFVLDHGLLVEDGSFREEPAPEAT